MRKDLFVALTLATLLSGHAVAQDLTGTLKKVTELGYHHHRAPRGVGAILLLDDKRQPVGFAIDICARSSTR